MKINIQVKHTKETVFEEIGPGEFFWQGDLLFRRCDIRENSPGYPADLTNIAMLMTNGVLYSFLLSEKVEALPVPLKLIYDL